jgi:hypothetical protein
MNGPMNGPLNGTMCRRGSGGVSRCAGRGRIHPNVIRLNVIHPNVSHPNVLYPKALHPNVLAHHSAAAGRLTVPVSSLVYMGLFRSGSRSGRPIMEEGIDAPRGFGADALNLHEIGQRGPLYRFERAKMHEQRAFAGRADAGNFLQPGFA